MTPYEAWMGMKPNVSHLHVFGCGAYSHVPKDERNKIDPKARKSIFMGYGDGVKGYRLYDQDKQRIYYSRDVIFHEARKDNVQSNGEHQVNLQEQQIEIDCRIEEVNQQEMNGERPQRERRPPDRYGEWVYVADNTCDPKSVDEAVSSNNKEKWMEAMKNEIDSLKGNDVWDLVKLPEGRKAVGSKWVFKTKHDAEGNIERYKARLVAQGYNQKYGIDYDGRFCPVVRFESIRTVIALAAIHNLKLRQLDITTAFLNGWLKEDIYMKQSKRFEIGGKENLVCKLKRSINGLKQSSRCWNEELDKFLKQFGFKQSASDTCIYILNSDELLIVAVYVDDIVVAGSSEASMQTFIDKIGTRFKIKDMGNLHHFLGVRIEQIRAGEIWIGQPTYTLAILKKFGMEDSKSAATPVEAGRKLVKVSADCELVNIEMYQSAVGSLLYLSTKTRPDIAYAVGKVARFCSKPSVQHWKAVKRIQRYRELWIDV